jgi:hypothetical protein
MNDTFSFSRFALLTRKFTKEHIVTYVLYLAALGGILTIIYGLVVLTSLEGRFPQDAARNILHVWHCFRRQYVCRILL